MHSLSPDRIDAPTVIDWLRDPDAVTVIDVRSPAEYETAHIAGSYNVPLNLLGGVGSITRIDFHLPARNCSACGEVWASADPAPSATVRTTAMAERVWCFMVGILSEVSKAVFSPCWTGTVPSMEVNCFNPKTRQPHSQMTNS